MTGFWAGLSVQLQSKESPKQLERYFAHYCSSMVRMRYVEFGEIRTSVLGFGCGSVLGRVGRRDSLQAMNTAWNAGITLFDTARSYGYGEAEGLLGEFLQGKRGQATVVTKFGILPANPVAWKRLAKPVVRAALRLLPQARGLVRRGAAGEMSAGHFDIATLRASLNESLRQLRTDYMDVLLMHLPPVSVFQQQDLMAELERVVREGKARRIGVSTDNIPTLHEMPGFLTVAQFPYPVLSLNGISWKAGNEGLFTMVNHPFGGAGLAQQAAEKIAQLATDGSVGPALREKLQGDSRERLAEIVFGGALADTRAQAVVTSMLQPPNLRANLAAIGSERFTTEELAVVRERVVQSGH
jgi:aryl-alcohol dehydrogenase-like predicted oxidoreductase